MQLTDRDRKRLWGKAGNRCAICGDLLTRPAVGDDREAVIGEEAHIIGAQPGAARYEPMDLDARDAYENQILLCPTHHTEVDAQPRAWPASRLRAIKDSHEAGIERQTQRLPETSAEPRRTYLNLILSGEAIVGVLYGAQGFDIQHETFATDEERAAGRDLLQAIQDWGEILDDIGPAGRIDAETGLTALLTDTMDQGLLLYGAAAPRMMRVNNEPVSLHVANFYLRRAASIKAEQHSTQTA
jgi:hypothetical protein